VIFDRVEVPWDRVFINGSVNVYNRCMSMPVLAAKMHQALVRAQTKLEFAWGLAMAMTEALGDKSPVSMQMLGEMKSFAELTKATLAYSEDHPVELPYGLWTYNVLPLLSIQAHMTVWMPRVMEIFKQLGSHNLLATPTRAMFDNAELRPLIDRYFRGPEGFDSERRTQILRLAWDFVGTGFASRGDLYERYYLSSNPRMKQNVQMSSRGSQRERADRLVKSLLES
jgi:4-hydroxyphenylacetate 3-monooxygenase